MGEPTKAAFCSIFFGHNGGKFNDLGLPIMDEPIRGLCPHPYNCGSCPLMLNWLREITYFGWEVSWECERCIKQSLLKDIENMERALPGYFHDGEDERLTGCTKCGWEGILQLVLRKQKAL